MLRNCAIAAVLAAIGLAMGALLWPTDPKLADHRTAPPIGINTGIYDPR
jgi:hypothetical protein